MVTIHYQMISKYDKELFDKALKLASGMTEITDSDDFYIIEKVQKNQLFCNNQKSNSSK